MSRAAASESARRGLLVAGCAILITVLLASSPAISAKRSLTRKQAFRLFYTKAAAEARFLNDTAVVNVQDTVDPNEAETRTVPCPDGRQALGGGVSAAATDVIIVQASGPTIAGAHPGTTAAGSHPFADGWFVEVHNFDADAQPYGVSVVCARPRT